MTTDVLRWPVVGPFVRWRHARRSLQIVLLAAAVAIVVHGLLGPPVAPANLATVATWVHYRGLLILALLAAGNLFCTGCPFVLARDAGRRIVTPARRWPSRLRTKWIGIALLVVVLFTYELFDLWALPAATAAVVIAYFVAAIAVDLAFAGATFCKYLCPIGQFNFVAATVSPLELRVRQPEVCGACRTFDCIAGRPPTAAAPRGQRGCELRLFLPSKVGNMDCTFCLDCVQACPHDNVALTSRVPGAELVDARRRSGVGRLTERADIAALALVFTFGALLNAFAMVGAATELQRAIGRTLAITSEPLLLAALFIVVLLIAPAIALGAAAQWTRAVVRTPRPSAGRVVTRFAYALIPLGVGVWVAHYGFHLATGVWSIVPVAQSAALELLGSPVLGAPRWTWVGIQPGAVFPLQLGALLLGSLGSLAVAYGISERDHPDAPLAAALPWLGVVLVLFVAAVWILTQPMEMRGTLGVG